MPTQIANFDFYQLQYDTNGNLADSTQLTALTAAAQNATDVALIAHGFRNDENDATSLYTHFLTSLRTQLARPELQSVAARKLIFAGVYWPSKAYPESWTNATPGTGTVQDIDATGSALATAKAQLEELQRDATQEQKHVLAEAIDLLPALDTDPALQDRFATLVLSILAPADDLADPTEGLGLIRSTPGSDLLRMLKRPLLAPIARGAAVSNVEDFDNFNGGPSGTGSVQDLGSIFDSVLGAAGKLANLATWYQMKSRSGLVGETGVARAIRALKASPLNVKVHLIGHSLGGRLMAACGRALTQAPAVHPDSMSLLEAAFSHFGFSPNNGQGQVGFFRDVIGKKIVTGPIIETFSAQDTVVGYVYAIASRLANDNVKAIGDATDPFGGIGRNGAQATPESTSEILHDCGTPYSFRKGIVNNLDGSGGLITSHGDVTNDRVTYAVANAVAAT